MNNLTDTKIQSRRTTDVMVIAKRVQICRALINPFKGRYQIAPFPMCITSKALAKLVGTLGVHQPETGGFLFGPTETMGIDLFEFDVQGSDQASATIYSPDSDHGLQRMDYHLSIAEARVMWGIAHSHPAGFAEPSQADFNGNGDLGYAAQFFAENEAAQWFFMPIVTQQKGQVWISPFLVCRDNPNAPFIAPSLKICAPDQFPEAEYNPAFLKRIAIKAKVKSTITPLPLLPAPKVILALPAPEAFTVECHVWNAQRRRKYWERIERRRNGFEL